MLNSKITGEPCHMVFHRKTLIYVYLLLLTPVFSIGNVCRPAAVLSYGTVTKSINYTFPDLYDLNHDCLPLVSLEMLYVYMTYFYVKWKN